MPAPCGLRGEPGPVSVAFSLMIVPRCDQKHTIVKHMYFADKTHPARSTGRHSGSFLAGALAASRRSGCRPRQRGTLPSIRKRSARDQCLAV